MIQSFFANTALVKITDFEANLMQPAGLPFNGMAALAFSRIYPAFFTNTATDTKSHIITNPKDC